jgi:hypothetical protein
VIEPGKSIVGRDASARGKIEIPRHPVQRGKLEVQRRSLGQEGKIPFVQQFVVADPAGTGEGVKIADIGDQGPDLSGQGAAAKGFELLPVPDVGSGAAPEGRQNYQKE